ncbi:MAG TPA: hypothetical protein VFV50_11240 [Bdellovibrionales bacterium]|nr:hypothetical protein [Bdellovibrionales bacterium]
MRLVTLVTSMLICISAAAAIPPAGAPAKNRVGLLALKSIVLEVPKDWNAVTEELVTHHQNPIHIAQLDFSEKAFKASIKIMKRERNDPKFTDLSELAKQLLAEGKKIEAQTKEKKTVLEPIKGKHPGHRFTFTNAQSKPGEFKVMKRGVLTVRDMVVSYVIYQNEPQNADAAIMQKAIENLALARSTDAPTKKQNRKSKSARAD